MTIEFIIPTYDRREQLISMLSSINSQITDNWKANVVIDGNPNSFAYEVVEWLNNPNIYITCLGNRYNDWGHTPRNVGKNNSEADYIVMTGDDNYYVPSFTYEIEQASKSKPGLIYWDMITNNWENYTWFNTRTEDAFIDMGAFATRRDLAHQIDLVPSCFAADHAFVLEFNQKFPTENIIKINKILFVHN